MTNKTSKHCRGFLLFAPVIIAAIAALLALAVFALWNNVLTDILPVKLITYWQALGLLALTRILVGGFPRRGGWGGGWGAGRRNRQLMQQHWNSLTPAQRENLRTGMDQRTCCCPPWHTPQPNTPSAQPENTTGGEPTKV